MYLKCMCSFHSLLFVRGQSTLSLLADQTKLDESAELTVNARIAVAKAAHPTLLHLLQPYRQFKGVPSIPYRCFVYGLHLSSTQVSVFAHFILPDTRENEHDRFCQILVARFAITYDPCPEDNQDELFLRRWRLVIALFAVLRHVQYLDHELSITALGRSLPHATAAPLPALCSLHP